MRAAACRSARRHAAPQPAVEARADELEQALREVIASAAPHFKLATARTVGAADLPCQVELRPAGLRICLDDLLSRRPRAVAGSKALAADAAPCPQPGAGSRAPSRSGCHRRAHAPACPARSRAGSRPVVLPSRRPPSPGAAGFPERLDGPRVACRSRRSAHPAARQRVAAAEGVEHGQPRPALVGAPFRPRAAFLPPSSTCCARRCSARRGVGTATTPRSI